MSLNVPEFMPILSSGSHAGPQDGACIMEYASFIAGEEWTDLPKCTNFELAIAAQEVNDDLDDEERQQLLTLLPRLMGTSIRNDDVDWAIAQAAVDFVEPLVGHPAFTVTDWARDAITELSMGNSPRHTIGSAFLAVRLTEGDRIAFLSALIDAYDQATGRTAPATVTQDDLRRCAELTGASA